MTKLVCMSELAMNLEILTYIISILPKPRAYLVLDYFSCKQFLEEMIVVWANMEVCDAQIENYTLAVLTINCCPKTMLTMGLSTQFT